MTEPQAEPRVWTRDQSTAPPSSQAQSGGNGQAQEPQRETGQEAKAPAQEAPKQPEGPWIGKLPLRRKVNAHGEMVNELTFREPTGGDIADVGNPIIPGATGRLQFDGPIMTEMMARLAVVTPKTIRDLHPRDWTNGAYMIAHFFLPDM